MAETKNIKIQQAEVWSYSRYIIYIIIFIDTFDVDCKERIRAFLNRI